MPRDVSSAMLLKDLHWLPIKERISFKIAVTVYKSLTKKTPEYITELLTIRASTRALRSNDGITLEVPRSRTRYGDRAFSRCGPRIWNSLPLDIRQSTSEQIFRKKLKTFLFSQAFSV